MVDEIERLTKELDHAHGDIASIRDDKNDELLRRTTENQRISKAYKRDCETYRKERDALSAEVQRKQAVYDAAHEAAMYCVRDGDGEAHIAPRYMQALDDALNATVSGRRVPKHLRNVPCPYCFADFDSPDELRAHDCPADDSRQCKHDWSPDASKE